MSAIDPAQVQAVQRMLARERLAIDEPGEGRTTFLSHIGAQPRLVPGAWIAHRELIYALALANLSQAQRASLAHAVVVEHGHEFGVGQLVLETVPSGLPLGGSSLLMRPRSGSPRCLYTWAMSDDAAAVECDWLLLRAQPGWALDDPPRTLDAGGLATLATIGGEVLVLVPSAVAARQVADACAGTVEVAAHPRFAPHLEGPRPEAPVLLWPHDGLDGAGLRRHEIRAVVLIAAPEAVRQRVEEWAQARPEEVEVVEAGCPGRIGRAGLESFWRGCGRPKVMLRGDSAWAHAAEAWLERLGAQVQVQGEATQLGLF